MTEREELELCLSQNLPDIGGKELIIWGTGNTAQLYQEGLSRLEVEGFYISAYVDSNESKWGKEFNGKKIYSPQDVQKLDNIVILICSPTPRVIHEISQIIEGLGLSYYHIDEVILKAHKDQVLSAYDLLNDEKSKHIYAELIKCHMQGIYPDSELVSDNDKQYFEWGKVCGERTLDSFIDCGAYVGDSIERYIWNLDGVFKKIIALEPDAGNYAAMEKRVERLKSEWNIQSSKIELFPYGVGNESMEMAFDSYDTNNGLGSKFVSESESDETCKIVALDDILPDEKYNFLKADIESFEYKMLEGANDYIQKYHPNIAVCIYHNVVDFYSIINMLHDKYPEYFFAVRHYTNVLSETVLYCWLAE